LKSPTVAYEIISQAREVVHKADLAGKTEAVAASKVIEIMSAEHAWNKAARRRRSHPQSDGRTTKR
jgi:hypothetical protein